MGATTKIGGGAWRAASLAAVLLLLSAAGLTAAPLDKEACDKLKAEIVQMEKAGVKANKARGPEWAKAHLVPDKLAEIARLIDAEEQVAFRCPQPQPPAEQAEAARPAAAPKGKKDKAKSDSAAADTAAASAAKTGPSAPAPEKSAKGKKKSTQKAQQKSKPEGASSSPAASDTATPTPRQP